MTKKPKQIGTVIAVWIVMAYMWFMGFLTGRASKENEISNKEEG